MSIKNIIINFFDKIFGGKIDEVKYIEKINNKIKNEEIKEDKNDFIKSISIKNKNQSIDKTKELAEMLMNGSVNIKDLKENEVNDMIDYFKSYVSEMKKELDYLKRNHH